MPFGPRPAGWKGGSEDFEFIVNGSAGRRGVNDDTDGDKASDGEWRRNCYYPKDFEENFGC